MMQGLTQRRVTSRPNGLLFDRRAWEELELDGLVESVWVSIDAARPDTYAVVRRGGSFERVMQSFAFLGALRREGQIRSLRLGFVVQALNFREMPGSSRSRVLLASMRVIPDGP